MKKVSVVIPTYNQACYLRECLDSVCFQDYPDLEIIIVDDGSTDNTEKVLEAFVHDLDHATTSYLSRYDEKSGELERIRHMRYPKKGREFRIVSHKTNRGLAVALNTGFRMCMGEYCTYVPSDNVCYPNMIAELAVTLDVAGADFVYSNLLIFDDDRNITRAFRLPEYSFKACFQDWYLCGVSKLYRRTLHDRFGYYDEALLAHDHELFQRFATGGAKFHHVAKSLMGVRQHEGDGREIDLHSPDTWRNLIEESRQLVIAARKIGRKE